MFLGQNEVIDNEDRDRPKTTSYTLDGEQCTVETVGEGFSASIMISALATLSIIIL